MTKARKPIAALAACARRFGAASASPSYSWGDEDEADSAPFGKGGDSSPFGSVKY